ncbi:hypothetical protein PYW08_008028 [Mythimna loreyi]|uniref:Uncharacterized protein n=1 Tax=Mythimna loreyi TaxID=667449 RepID=A0ACC2QAV7_9NEOP|nr:hypothetical protein PYW08_008028 [Mythimna loreyi]
MLSDTTFRIATCLRLGAPSGAPHRCQCGEVVDRLGHHGLSCSRSARRIARHASINDIIRRALVTAGVPAVLETNGLARDDGKRPDGMTIMPWKLGRPLVWDATCVDTEASPEDTVEHTVEVCPAWEEHRRVLVGVIGGGDLSRRALVQAMVRSEEEWRAVASFCEAVMLVKEEADRIRQRQRRTRRSRRRRDPADIRPP